MAENLGVHELLALAIEQRNQANDSLISARREYETERDQYRAEMAETLAVKNELLASAIEQRNEANDSLISARREYETERDQYRAEMAETLAVKDELLASAIEQRNEANDSLISARREYETERDQYRAEMAETLAVKNELLASAIEQRNEAHDSLISARREYEIEREQYRAGFAPNIFGHQMYINPRDPGMALGSLNGQDISGNGEIGFFQRAVRPGHRVLDLGANIGLFTLLFARSAGPAGKVYAFEPGPLSFLLLSANVHLNGYRNVVLENAAVADRTEELVFFVSVGESDCRIDGTVSDETGRQRSTIRGVALDDYFRNGETVDVIKMDIQGAEPMALRGMEKLLARSPNVQVVMELMPASIAFRDGGPGEMLAHLQSLGFKLYDLPEYGIESPVTAEQLLKTVGPGLVREMTNIVLRRS